ncbi:histidine phosphatase family protein [Candidatus Saccharibacteria bacterium]|nr:histidine phosphatase family protein [Candidatus Saccharibacteria bacterium]
MSLPIDLIFVRHGESATNELYDKVRAGELPDGDVNSLGVTHDSEILLTEKGAEEARAIGEWLKQNALSPFDRYYCSPFYRTRQTAALLGLGGQWRLDDRLREQDWAEFAIVMKDENRARLFPSSFERFSKNPWYWAPPSGESKSGQVRTRLESWFATLAREVPDGTVIAVTHVGVMATVNFLLERMNFDDGINIYDSLPSGAILWYSRRNPTTGEISESISWRRMICPWDENLSWNNGEWIELKLAEKVLSDEQLLASVKNRGDD